MIILYELRRVYYQVKRILTILAFISGSLLIGNHDLHRIERLVEPYEKAMEFMINLDPARKISDHDVYVFFSRNDLYEKKDIHKFKRVLRTVKKMTYTKKSLREHRDKLESIIEGLDKIQDFIVDYAITHYALMVYYEIAGRYYYIDEQHVNIVNLIIHRSDKLGLPDMQGRGLYKFAKIIDLDLRRLTTLFVSNNLSDDAIIKVNQIKTKLLVLKSKITQSSVYKSQIRKTRWLKALGVIILGVSVVYIYAAVVFASGITKSLVWGWLYLTPLTGVSMGIACHEMHEASKYNIPVHSHSLFSWFAPVFFPLTWIPRG